MRRWLKASEAAVAAPIDPAKESAWQTAVKAEMARVWDATKNRDEMLSYVELWLAKDAPVEVRQHRLREELHPLLVEVYQEKHPEDFTAKAEEVVASGVGPYRMPGELEEPK